MCDLRSSSGPCLSGLPACPDNRANRPFPRKGLKQQKSSIGSANSTKNVNGRNREPVSANFEDWFSVGLGSFNMLISFSIELFSFFSVMVQRMFCYC